MGIICPLQIGNPKLANFNHNTNIVKPGMVDVEDYEVK